MRTLVVLIGLSTCGCFASYVEPDPRAVPRELVLKERRSDVEKILDSDPVEIMIPRTPVRSTLEVYDFLLEELPFTAGVVRALGKEKYEIFREKLTGSESEREKHRKRHTFHLNDRKGMELAAELVYRGRDKWIYYMWGTYRFILGDIEGQAVIVVTAYEVGGILETEARIFVPVVKAAGGLVESVVKKKSSIFVDAAKTVCEAAADNPDGLYQVTRNHDEVDQKVLEEFRRRFLQK